MLTQQGLSVDVEDDRVLLKVGSAVARFPYMSAHRIAQRLRLYAKAAMDCGNANSREWRNVASPMGVAATRMGSGKPTSKARKMVGVSNEGVLVVLDLDGFKLKMEHETALTLASWLVTRAKQAGAWAGDPGGALLVAGRLS